MRFKHYLLVTLFSLAIGCGTRDGLGSDMFEWIDQLTTCPVIDSNRYPDTTLEADALFQRAVAADDVYPRSMSQSEVVSLYQQAAKQGHWVAMNNLAISYYKGYGIEEDEEQALYWYREVEKLDIAEGYTNMALVYRNGIGVDQDQDVATQYLVKASQLGDRDAQFLLGKRLYSPLKQKDRAYKMLNCAVEQGHREAAYELALHYDVDENYDLAYQAYRRGAKLGSRNCINALRDGYSHVELFIPLGLNEDPERAECLYSLSKKLGKDPTLQFPDLDERCPANVPQPPGRH